MAGESVSKETPTILVCLGTGCVSSNSPQIYDELAAELKKHNLSDKVELKFTGCHGFCQRGPIVIVEPEGIFYSEVKVKDAEVNNEWEW